MVLTLHRSAPIVPQGSDAGRVKSPIPKLLLEAALVVVAVPFAIIWRRTPDRED